MTKMTPQQMREVADRLSTTPNRLAATALDDAEAALRAAADRLEAVQRLTELTPSMVHPITRAPVDVVYASDLLAALSGDAAPQEDRDA